MGFRQKYLLYRSSFRVLRGFCSFTVHSLAYRQINNKGKGTSPSLRRIDMDAAAHHFNQFGTNRQSKPGPSILSSSSFVGLGKCLKKPFHMFRVYSDSAVAAYKFESFLSRGSPALPGYLYLNFTFTGKLYRVAQ